MAAHRQGSVDKSVFPVVFTDTNGGIPGVGNTAADTLTLTSTAVGSFAWQVLLGGAGGDNAADRRCPDRED